MNCSHCQHWNPDDAERCRLCDGKLHASGNDTSEWTWNVVAGNLAAAPEHAGRQREQEVRPAAQRMLFADRPASKVIAFDNPPGGTRMGARVEPPAAAAVAPKVATPRKAGTQAKPATDVQPKLDLLPAAPVTPRTLKTKVVASIYCDATVATLTHRSLAGAVDFSLILIEYLMCLGAYHLMGGELPVNRLGYVTFAAAFVVMAMFYGLVWAMGNIETPGMRWASLRLTNFDGQETEPSQRLLRYFGTCLGLATCGFGLLWALVDEESLTWQDHMSKTFPTYHRIETNFCKAR